MKTHTFWDDFRCRYCNITKICIQRLVAKGDHSKMWCTTEGGQE